MLTRLYSGPFPGRRWIFLGFLGALHLVFQLGPLTSAGRIAFLVHVGLGLVWQPFIQPKRRVGSVSTASVILVSGLSAYFLNWGLLLLWAMLLAGVIGGKIFLYPDRWERLFYLLGLGYLIAASFTLVLPEFLASLRPVGAQLTGVPPLLIAAALPLMALLPWPSNSAKPSGQSEIVDYVYGVLVLLLQAVIVLGSISFALIYSTDYLGSLMMTLAIVAAILLALGLIWQPTAGFGGLGNAVAQHVLSLGLPLQDWMQALAEISAREKQSGPFLETACVSLLDRLPGITGVRYEGPELQGTVGKMDGQPISLEYMNLRITLFAHSRPSPSLLWHYDLTCRLLAEYFQVKWQGALLQRYAYMQAIHETGARLTHDIKNMLQSLDTLCMAASHEGVTPSPGFIRLLQRQLPEITSRLRQTLLKLAAPSETPAVPAMSATDWLLSIQQRYAASPVRFLQDGNLAHAVIADPQMFSSIAENLLQNLIGKQAPRSDITGELRLFLDRDEPGFDVSDSGPAIPLELSEHLMREPVPSENGLGIGLYQSARLAASRGYRLDLAENRDGHVRFRLAPARPQSGTGQSTDTPSCSPCL